MKRFLTIAVTIALVVSTFTVTPAKETSNFPNTTVKHFKNYSSLINHATNDYNEESNSQYKTKEILVLTNNLSNTFGAYEACTSDNNLYVLKYNTISEARNAYSKLVAFYGSSNVAINEEINVKDIVSSLPDACMAHIDTGDFVACKYINSYKGKKNNVTIAVIDSGVGTKVANPKSECDVEIKDNTGVNLLKSKLDLSRCKDFSGDGNIYDTSDHGTNVSYTIAANTPDNVNIIMYKICDPKSNSSTLKIYTALMQAVYDNVDILNISIYLGNTSLLNIALKQLYENKTITCVAAGNHSSNVDDTTTLSSSPYTVTVSSVSSDSFLPKTSLGLYALSDFSDYGNSITFSGFGDHIYTINSNGDEVSVSGTSFSSPLVAAQFSYLKTFDNTVKQNKMINVMKKFVAEEFNIFYILSPNYHDNHYGYGYMDFRNIEMCTKGEENCKVLWHADYEPDIIESETTAPDIYDNSTNPQDDNIKVPAKKILKITSLKNKKKGSVTIKYTRISGMRQYKIMYSRSRKFKKFKFKTTRRTTKNIKGLKKGKTYYFKVDSSKNGDFFESSGVRSKVRKIKIRK